MRETSMSICLGRGRWGAGATVLTCSMLRPIACPTAWRSSRPTTRSRCVRRGSRATLSPAATGSMASRWRPRSPWPRQPAQHHHQQGDQRHGCADVLPRPHRGEAASVPAFRQREELMFISPPCFSRDAVAILFTSKICAYNVYNKMFFV